MSRYMGILVDSELEKRKGMTNDRKKELIGKEERGDNTKKSRGVR